MENKELKAHRYFYERCESSVVPGAYLQHYLPPDKCIGHACCYPAHLRISSSPKAAPPLQIKRCPKGHPMTPENTVIEKRKGRPKPRCRKCRQESWRRNSARRSAMGTLAARKKKGDHLCNNTQGGPLYELRYWLVPSIKAGGVADFTPHDLRHTAASRWVMSGVPLAAVAKYLGDSVEMVMRYSHLQPEVNARAVEAAMSFYSQPDGNKQKKESKPRKEKK